MIVVSVNVGVAQPLIAKNKVVQTGIFKRPLEGLVQVLQYGLAGDERVDHSHRGALERAVYAYPSEHYDKWRTELPRMNLPFGTFGENLATEGILDEDVFIGDRYQVGSAVVTVTQPRMPCYKLAARLDRSDIIDSLIASRRHGFFFSVSEEGTISAGDSIRLLHRDPASVSIIDIVSLYVGRNNEPQLMQRAMALEALPPKWKSKFAQRASA